MCVCVSVLAIWNVWCLVFWGFFFGRWCAVTQINAPWSSVSWAWATDCLLVLFLTCKKLSGNLTFSFLFIYFLYVGWVSSTGGQGQVFNETARKTQNSFRLMIDKSEREERKIYPTIWPPLRFSAMICAGVLLGLLELLYLQSVWQKEDYCQVVVYLIKPILSESLYFPPQSFNTLISLSSSLSYSFG